MKLLTQWAFTSSILILIVLAARYLFRNRLSARLRYALWGVVLLRLLVPFQIELPAPVSAALPVLASNLAPEVGDVELYALRTGSRPMSEDGLAELRENGMEVGDVIGTEAPVFHLGGKEVEGGAHCFVLSDTGVDTYFFYTTLPRFLMVLWAIGAIWAALTIFRSNRYFFGKLKHYRHALEGPEAPVPVYTAANLSSPCLFGVFKPAVYVTPEAAENPDTLRHVLAHELTHYAHRDHLWSLLRCLALALHWYNPLVWLAVWLSKGDGELACDEGAVARLGEAERIPYGRTLVDMVAKRSLRPGDLLSCSTAMTGGKKSIQQRVAALVKKPETVRAALFAAAAVVALATVFVFAGRAQTSGTPDNFQGYLDMTTGIRYYPPSYSSTFYPNPITDPELLSQAKEALSGVSYLRDDDPQPTLDSRALLDASRMALPNDAAENTYTLLWQNNRTYLLPGDVWGDLLELRAINGGDLQITGQTGTLVSEPGVNLISILRSLAGEQQQLLSDTAALLDPELEDYTRVLLRERGIRLQGRPEDSGSASFYAGYFNRKSGETELWYEGDGEHSGVWVVGLANPADRYTVRADLPMEVFNAAENAGEKVAYEQLGPGAFGAALRPEDVISVTAGDGGPGQTAAVDIRALKEQIVQGLHHKRSAEYDGEKHGQYAITVHVEKDVGYYLKDGGTDGLILSVGSEPDVVCLRHRILASPQSMMFQFVYSPELYRTVREEANRNAPPEAPVPDSQSTPFDKPDTDDEKDDWDKQQTAEYQAVGVTVDGKNYYYQGQLVNIFLDIRANQSFYTLDTNPAGTVNVKIIRNADDKITGAEYMTDTEAAELLADLRGGED